MKRMVFIGPDHGTAVGGREQLSRLHRRALADLLGDRLDIILLPRRPLSGRSAIGAVFNGRIDGTDQAVERRILTYIVDGEIDQVWLDGSNLGALADAIARRLPQVGMTTFFHNVEARFFLGALRQRPALRALGVVAANFTAERMAVRASTQRVALNRRDSQLMKRLYGRGADHLLPMAIPAPAAGIGEGSTAPFLGDYLLFVGGAFYANQAGIQWYAKHVAPSLPMPTLVVGRGLDALRSELEGASKIVLVGEVESLGAYYRHAKAVVAPIFDGSGMKTKVAEAMMHGKRIVGTREAFSGYEDVIAEAGWQCDDSAQFVSAVKEIAAKDLPPFDPTLRLRFDEQFSYEAARRRIAKIVGLPKFESDQNGD